MFDVLLKLISVRKYKIFPISNGIKMNRGMTYVELIVVLSIFSVMSSVVLFNYTEFEDKVNIKVLANDVALKIVEAQKSSVSGKWNISAGSTWKPSYGLYFNLTPGANTSNKIFYSFVDLNQSKLFDYGTYICPNSECLERIDIKKNNYISDITAFYQIGGSVPIANDLQITFTRPSSGATFRSSTSFSSSVSYVQITLNSTSGISSTIQIYASGRIQIN